MTTMFSTDRVSSLVLALAENPVTFVAAKNPDRAFVRPANCLVISETKPKPEDRFEDRGGEEGDSREDQGSENDSSETESGPSSLVDTPVSSPELSTGDEDDEAAASKKSTQDLTRFYDLDESKTDRGSRPNSQILKSWTSISQSPIGLENQAVTCYMNSAMQMLLHVPAMGHYLQEVLRGKYESVIARNSVTMELAKLYGQLINRETRKKSIYPSKMIRRLDDINPLMSPYEQGDSHEFYMSLMGRLQEDSTPKGKKLNTSIVHDMFGGSLRQKILCKNCGHVSTTSQDFYDLPVSFYKRPQDGYKLETSIDNFFRPETISPVAGQKDSGYECENCKQQTKAIKTIAIEDAPEYLTVHIKRFKYKDNNPQKVKEPMAYTPSLVLSKYGVPGSQALKYKLIAVIVHEGRTLNRGHYVGLCRQPDGTWAEYDDEIVTKTSLRNVLKQQEGAYLLLYAKLTCKPTSEAVSEPAPASPPKSKAKTEAKASSPQSPVRKRIHDDIDDIFEKRSRRN